MKQTSKHTKTSENIVSGFENERFRIANPVWLSYRPENGDFSGFHFRILFSGRSPAEKGGLFSGEIPIRKRHPDFGLTQVVGGDKLGKRTQQYSYCSSTRHKTRIRHIYLSAVSTLHVLVLLLLLCPAIRWHTPQAPLRADGIGE